MTQLQLRKDFQEADGIELRGRLEEEMLSSLLIQLGVQWTLPAPTGASESTKPLCIFRKTHRILDNNRGDCQRIWN